MEMKNTKYILFDLDGTLTDPAEGITNSVAYALEKFGIKTEDKTELYKFIGPPLVDSFKEFYMFSDTDALTAVKFYREYFSLSGIFENKLYDGVKELLKEIKDSGKQIILATSKPEKFAIQILEFFDILKYFKYVSGATMDESRNKKEDVIAYALKNCDIADKSEAIMVGDREFDIKGAHINGLKAVGILFGYGSESELKSAQADFIAADICELRKIILENM